MEKRSAIAASDAERAFQKLVKTLIRSDASIEAPQPTRREFGSNALKVNGKIFAMLVRGSLVLKLPKARVEALIAEDAMRSVPGTKTT
jgi:TfoX/Sxy family transcriptional regulator of competence genes